MYFKEKNEGTLKNNILGADNKDNPIDDSQTLSGISEISNDMTSLLKKVAIIYGKSIDFKNDLSKKSSVIKGAITQNDVQSMIKIISHDIDNYLKQIGVTANKLRRSYANLDSKVNTILISNEMDEKYKSVFNKTFFHKTIGIYIDKYLQETINSGVFLIELKKEKNKSDVFIKNTYKSILKNIHSELRYLDIVAHIEDDIFAVLIVDISRDNFEFITEKIIEKIKIKDLKQSVSAGMLNNFTNSSSVIQKLKDALLKVKNTKDDYIFI
jgi:GGDEF domain-containing protein